MTTLRRRSAALAVSTAVWSAVALGGCAVESVERNAVAEPAPRPETEALSPEVAAFDPVEDTAIGIVIAEEPRAALVARDVLERGGSPADAATALGLALSVTYPVAASLGSGGVCLYNDPDGQVVASVDFLPKQPGTPGPIAVPGLVRGLALIHARWGRLPWAGLVAPAERMAVSGHAVSRALVERLDRAPEAIDGDPRLRALLREPDGSARAVGARLVQPGLAGTLSLIRTQGPNDFYTGQAARRVLSSMVQIGGTVSAADLFSYRPMLRPAQALVLADGATVYVPSGAIGAGALASDVLDAWGRQGREGASDQGSVRKLMDDVLALHGVASLPDRDFGTTGFLIADRSGAAIACGLTMNGVLGAGRIGFADGIIHARAPSVDDPISLSSALLTSGFVHAGDDPSLVLASIGTGRPQGAATALAALAVGAARPEGVAALFETDTTDIQGRAHFLQCATELRSSFGGCGLRLDPHAAGLVIAALGTAP